MTIRFPEGPKHPPPSDEEMLMMYRRAWKQIGYDRRRIAAKYRRLHHAATNVVRAHDRKRGMRTAMASLREVLEE